MHIALYSPSWPPAGAANGIVSYVATVRDYLASQGHLVSVLSEGSLHLSDGRTVPLTPPVEELRGVDRLKRRVSGRFDSWHGGLPCTGRRLAAEFKAVHRFAPIDIIEMEESFGWSDIVQRLTGIPVVTRLHGPYFLKPPTPRTASKRLNDLQRRQMEGRAVRTSATITAPTSGIMKITSENYNRILRDCDAVIPNPIRLKPENPRWSLQRCTPDHILMIGRFDFWKGADTMLLAFEKLRKTRPHARLTLVGPEIGIETSPGHTQNFEEFCRSNLSPETAERINLTGVLNKDQIDRLRLDAFVTVVASRVETFSYALVEGLAAGTPMISTSWLSSDEIISDGESGFLTPVGNADALAQRLAWLFEHPETAAQVGANGRQHCARTFAVEAVGKRLLECYETVLQAPRQ